jgi:Hint domain
VRCLLNGRGITQVARQVVEYWHVELDRHDVLLADGLACESFLDTGQRAAFAGSAVTQLHPEFDAARTWDANACAPLLLAGDRVEQVRRKLAARAYERSVAS